MAVEYPSQVEAVNNRSNHSSHRCHNSQCQVKVVDKEEAKEAEQEAEQEEEQEQVVEQVVETKTSLE